MTQTAIPLEKAPAAVAPAVDPTKTVEKKEDLTLATIPEQSVFANAGTFNHAQRVAQMLSSSDLVPASYKGNVQNTMIALEMANRVGVSPLAVMQNLHIIQGKPSWSSSFIISAINSSKRFTNLLFKMEGAGDSLSCFAYAKSLTTGEHVEGPKVTMQMAKEEGWFNKAGSKWKTMPDLMIRYRAAAFFGRLYAPDIIMGMQTAEEVQDVAGKGSDEDRKNISENLQSAYK